MAQHRLVLEVQVALSIWQQPVEHHLGRQPQRRGRWATGEHCRQHAQHLGLKRRRGGRAAAPAAAALAAAGALAS
jgi:hypothetical protein